MLWNREHSNVSGTPLALTEWLMGAVTLCIAVSVLGFTVWWGAPDRELGVVSQIGRLIVALFGHGLVWLGLVIMAVGTGGFFEGQLGSWSGIPLVWSFWIALELITRELVWASAHARRSFGDQVGALGAAVTIGTGLVAKGALAFCLIAMLAAFLET